MAPHDPAGPERGDAFVRAIMLLCSLGLLWLVVTIAYAAWLGVFG